jgi:hypothetical protein
MIRDPLFHTLVGQYPSRRLIVINNVVFANIPFWLSLGSSMNIKMVKFNEGGSRDFVGREEIPIGGASGGSGGEDPI